MMRLTVEQEPGRGAAAFLAILMHILFLGLLVFGISWQNRYPQVTTVDLWSNLPAPPQPVEPPKPAPEVKAPPPPKPDVKPEPMPEPKPEAKPEPVKPDILLKEKAEQEKRKQEQQKLADQRKIELEHQRLIKEQLAKEEDARQLQQDKENALKQFEADQAAAQNRLMQETIDKIRAKIRHYVIVPQDIQGNPKAVYKVVLLPGGDVLSATLEKRSGVPAYDSSIERAIYNAQPLPLPSDPAQFPNFRELKLEFRPND